jgi:hypothetical protein
MKKIAVICASPRKFNPGMFSVDLAFHFLMQRHNVAAEINYFVLAYPSDQSFLPQLPFQYKLAQENLSEIYNSDAIVLWGDFLLSQHYHADLNKRLVKKKYAASYENAQRIINECLLFSSAPQGVHEKCFVFGCSQLLDSNNALADKVYLQLSNDLIGRAKGVWMRDIFSSLKMARIRNESINKCHGIDASLLLAISSEMPDIDVPSLSEHSSVGVFFKRTKVNPAVSLGFANELCRELGYDAEWISWFHPAEKQYRRGFKKHFPLLSSSGNELGILPLLSSLKKYQFVITDTYHLCLNAWNSGTPAICITNGNELESNSLSDKKKEVFYLTNEGQDFLVNTDTLNLFKKNYIFHSSKEKESKKRVLKKLMSSILNDNLADSIIGNIRSHAVNVEEDFMNKLKALVS